MRVLTLNLWHGLAPEALSYFAALESGYRRRRREERQLEAIGQIKADVVFLQEVNPLQERSNLFAQALNSAVFTRHDQVGLKVKGIGWPWNLNSGLATIVDNKFGPRLVRGLKLSGSKWSREAGWLSWQWAESRYALLVEYLDPIFGRVLTVNCHLHHGIEMDETLKDRVESLKEKEMLTANAAVELKERLRTPNLRREYEVQTLLDHLKIVKDRYSLILLGGDFNFTSASRAYQMVREFGFRDLWLEKHGREDEGMTFDKLRNSASHVFNLKFPLTVETEDLSFSPKTRQSVLDLLYDHEQRRRRIDYLFAMTNGTQIKIESIGLMGVPEADEIALSDHFGIVAHVEAE